MLEKLSIRHYALIDDAQIEFAPNLTALTGETGAGKSIIMGALGLLLGDKADNDVIRTGYDSAIVSASFSMDEPSEELLNVLHGMDIELDEGSLVLSRTIKNNGRSSITIQGIVKTRNELSLVGRCLVDISAQRDHQSLFLSSKQMDVLDSYAKDQNEIEAYTIIWNECKTLEKEKDELAGLLASANKEQDYLTFATDEIEKLNIQKNEDELISSQLKVIQSFEQIHEQLSLAVDYLHKGEDDGLGSITAMQEASKALASASKADASLLGLQERLESATIECQDIYETVRDYLDTMTFSQETLDQMQNRLSNLQRMKKKYGPSLDDVLAFYQQSKAKLEYGISGEERLSKLERQYSEKKSLLLKKAEGLSATRKKNAITLAKEVENTLHELGMGQAAFFINVERRELGPNGFDEVSFCICANPGLETRSIVEVASGGELSRIMLALKSTLEKNDHVQTLVFDEIDSGIGGTVAVEVAKQLEKLKAGHQVIVITHLASVASRADNHLVVSKYVKDGQSFTTIKAVSGESRVEEIARMLSGDSTSVVSLEHARQLLRN
jgi:DNA repair protein RecN (Recombination protein N)